MLKDAQKLPWKRDTIEATCLKCHLNFGTVDVVKDHEKSCAPNVEEAVKVRNHTFLNMCDATAGVVTKVRMSSIIGNDRPPQLKGDCYRYHCLRCDFQFPTSALLILHTICCRLLKAGLRNVCLLCSGGFESLDSLRNHMLSHVQLSWYTITDCKNSFFGNYGCSETDVTDENGKLIGRQLFNIKAEKVEGEPSVLKFPCFHCGKWCVFSLIEIK